MVLQTANKNGWFWYIPLHNNIVSVGVVAPFDYLFKGRGDYAQTYDEEVERLPGGARSASRARSGSPGYFATKDYSYRAKQVAGDGWVLVGDAFGVPRSAVFVRRAAGAASPASWPPTPSSRAWRRATRRRRSSGSGAPAFNEGVDRMRRLVCEYYDGFSFGNFVQQLSAPAGHGHRPADRRSVHRQGGQGLGSRWSRCTRRASRRFRRGTPARRPTQASDKANELVLPEGRRP